MIEHKAPLPGQLPPVVMMSAGETRTIQIDLAPILQTHQLACGAECAGAISARTRFGNTLEVTVSPEVGKHSLTAMVRVVLGSQENTRAVPFVIWCR